MGRGRTKRESNFRKSQAEIRRNIIKEQTKSTKKHQVITGWAIKSHKFNKSNVGLYGTKESSERLPKLMGIKSKAIKYKITIEEI